MTDACVGHLVEDEKISQRDSQLFEQLNLSWATWPWLSRDN